MWLYVPGMAAWKWAYDSRSLERGLSLTWKGGPMPPHAWSREWRAGSWVRRLSGLMWPASTAADFASFWLRSRSTSLPPATRARAKATQASAAVWQMTAGSGPLSGNSLANWNRATCSWKTSQLTLPGISESCSVTLPRAGGLRNGAVYERAPLVPRMPEIGFSALLPTPSAAAYGYNQGGSQGRVGKKRLSLEAMARAGLLPTPTASDHKRGWSMKRGYKGGPSLPQVVLGGDKTRCLSPRFVEWMMSLDAGWSCAAIDCTCSETE